jgi:phosphoglucomutase
MKFTVLAAAAAAAVLPSKSTSTDAFVPKAFLPKNQNYCRHHQASPVTLTEVPTSPIAGMKPGTSGLRKKVEVWQGVDGTNKYYVENFIQSLLDTAQDSNGGGMLKTMIVAGDGRYFNDEAIQIICRVLAANGVENIWVPKGGIMSTPAVSAAIRNRDGGAAEGGIILTASHNPGGPGEDFGIKYNEGYGQPAGEEFTDAVSVCGFVEQSFYLYPRKYCH